MVTLNAKSVTPPQERHPFDENFAFLGKWSKDSEISFFFIVNNEQIAYLGSDGIITMYDNDKEFVTVEGWCESMKIEVIRIFSSYEDYSITITY